MALAHFCSALVAEAVPLEGAPHLLQNLAAGESALIGKGADGGAGACGEPRMPRTEAERARV